MTKQTLIFIIKRQELQNTSTNLIKKIESVHPYGSDNKLEEALDVADIILIHCVFLIPLALKQLGPWFNIKMSS